MRGGPCSGSQCPFISIVNVWPDLNLLSVWRNLSIRIGIPNSKDNQPDTFRITFGENMSQVLRYEVHNISVCSPSLAITKLQIHLTLQQSVNDHKIFCITQNSWAHFLHSIFGTSRWPGVSNIKYITMLPSWFSQKCIYGLHHMNFNHRQIENQDMTIL